MKLKIKICRTMLVFKMWSKNNNKKLLKLKVFSKKKSQSKLQEILNYVENSQFPFFKTKRVLKNKKKLNTKSKETSKKYKRQLENSKGQSSKKKAPLKRKIKFKSYRMSQNIQRILSKSQRQILDKNKK